jgi:hypothetical protein
MRSIAIGMLGLVLVQGSAAAQTSQEQEKILRAFQGSVAEFTERHHGFDLVPDPLTSTTPGPPIFTLPVAMVFRQVIARTLDEQIHVTHMAGVGTELPLERHPLVFEPFPATELHEFPPLLARVLPPLPPSLEYRLIGNDLVLRDVNGDQIVAVLRDAVGNVPTAKR